jgi:hypothetical protein
MVAEQLVFLIGTGLTPTDFESMASALNAIVAAGKARMIVE